MRILAFRHVAFEGLGLIEPILRSREIACDYADLYCAAELPAESVIDAYQGLIFMGGPMSANDPLPYLVFEQRLIRKAIANGQAVLGICLGAQLIARAMGARVYPNAQKEIGWFDVEFTSAAHGDKLFAGLTGAERVFHWHGETFDLPAGADLLASSERCRNQAFRLGNRTYGLQFHPEVTSEMIADWCLQDANCGDVRELDRPIDPRANTERLAELSRCVFNRWCDLVDTAHLHTVFQ